MSPHTIAVFFLPGILSQAQDRSCSDFSGCGYYCVPYYQCGSDNMIITDGGGLIDPRTGSQDEEDCEEASRLNLAVTSRCSRLLEVCCLHPDTTRIPPRVNPGNPQTRNCGKRNPDGIKSAPQLSPSVGEAEFGEWPHVCNVLIKNYVEVGDQEKVVKVYQCGASLISEGVVLTAAHCVNDTENLIDKLIVRCGEWDSSSESEDLPFQERDVDRIEKHPCFNVDNHHNNYAILFLKSEFVTASHISPVCLPQPRVVLGQQICVSNGWGKDKFGAAGRYSTILKEVVIPLVKNDTCQQLLRDNTRLGPFFELDDSFICAGGQKGIDTCKGDGGSPLTCRQLNGPWFQAGIVSWGIGCGENDIPAVYANVAKASCWIDTRVRCYYGQENSFFGFSTGDCPDSSICTGDVSGCTVSSSTTTLEDEIFL